MALSPTKWILDSTPQTTRSLTSESRRASLTSASWTSTWRDRTTCTKGKAVWCRTRWRRTCWRETSRTAYSCSIGPIAPSSIRYTRALRIGGRRRRLCRINMGEVWEWVLIQRHRKIHSMSKSWLPIMMERKRRISKADRGKSRGCGSNRTMSSLMRGKSPFQHNLECLFSELK